MNREMELYGDVEAVARERDAAYATRHEDPARWTAAKVAYRDARAFYRTLRVAKLAFVHGDDSKVKALEALGIQVDLTDDDITAHNEVVVFAETHTATAQALAPET